MVWETGVQSQVESCQKTKKMVLDAALLNIQHYKVRIKDKVAAIQGMEKCPPLHLGVIATEKGAFGSPSTKVCQLHFTQFNNQKHFYFKLFSLVKQF